MSSVIECGVTSITPRRFRSDNTRRTVDRDPEVIADVAPTHRQLNVLIVKREIDLAWNAPLAYVKIKRRLQNPCQVVAMRDVDN